MGVGEWPKTVSTTTAKALLHSSQLNHLIYKIMGREIPQLFRCSSSENQSKGIVEQERSDCSTCYSYSTP